MGNAKEPRFEVETGSVENYYSDSNAVLDRVYTSSEVYDLIQRLNRPPSRGTNERSKMQRDQKERRPGKTHYLVHYVPAQKQYVDHN